MNQIGYGYEVTLPGVPYEDAVRRITTALGDQGFGILSEIDVAATLKKKLGVGFRKYTILGACNPQLAHRALEVEPQIGLLLPCNVVVQEADEGGSTVSVMRPPAMSAVVDNDAITPIMDEADTRLRRALDAISAG